MSGMNEAMTMCSAVARCTRFKSLIRVCKAIAMLPSQPLSYAIGIEGNTDELRFL
jgi:hypothetical protein